MVAKPKPVDRTDEILRAVAELQIVQAPNVAACKFDSAAPKRRREHPGQSNTRYVEHNANNTPRTTPGKWNQRDRGNQNRNRRIFDGSLQQGGPRGLFMSATLNVTKRSQNSIVTSHPDKIVTTDDPNNKQDLLQSL